MWRAPSSRPPSRDLLVPFNHRDKSRCYKIGCTYGTLGFWVTKKTPELIPVLQNQAFIIEEKSALRMADLVTAGLIPRGKTTPGQPECRRHGYQHIVIR